MKILLVVVALVLCVAAGAALLKQSQSETKTINTSDGQVTATSKTVDPTPQEIVLASVEQCLVFDKLVLKAKNFVVVYLPGVSNPTLKDYDEAFRIWQKSKDGRYTEHEVIEMLGAYLGNNLVEELQMEWVVVTDKYGTDYAVRGKKYEVLSFPFSSVMKRIENNQYDFMAGVYYVVQDMIASGNYKVR